MLLLVFFFIHECLCVWYMFELRDFVFVRHFSLQKQLNDDDIFLLDSCLIIAFSLSTQLRVLREYVMVS